VQRAGLVGRPKLCDRQSKGLESQWQTVARTEQQTIGGRLVRVGDPNLFSYLRTYSAPINVGRIEDGMRGASVHILPNIFASFVVS